MVTAEEDIIFSLPKNLRAELKALWKTSDALTDQNVERLAAMDLARSAFADAWGTAAVDTGLGGSIPFIADLLEVFPEAEVLVTGVEDPESRAHGIDESLHLGEFAKVCLAEALLLRGAGRLGGQAA